MKAIISILFVCGLGAVLCGMPMAQGQEDETPTPPKKVKKDESEDLAAVPASIKDKKLLNKAKLNTKAKVYFIYQSRAACAICVSELPGIVDAYKRMKGKKAEIVMLNIGDEKKDAKWVKDAKVAFPVVAPDQRDGIPFPYEAQSEEDHTLPQMVAVDAEGNKLGQANGSNVADFVKDWKKVVKDYEKQERKHGKSKKSSSASDEE